MNLRGILNRASTMCIFTCQYAISIGNRMNAGAIKDLHYE